MTTSFHDEDAHHLYVAPDRLDAALEERAELRLSSISQDQPHEFRAQSADTAARSLRDAEPELEKLVRSGYRTVVAWARRGEAERARYNLARVHADFLDGKPASAEPGVTFAHAGAARGLPRARGSSSRSCPSTGCCAAAAPRPGPARGRAGRDRLASPSCARATPVVHEDHGIARFVGFETKTVGGITRDYLELEFQDGDRVFVPSDQLHKISRYVGADAGDPPLSKLGGKQWEQMKLRARRAAEALAGELINLYAERKRRAGHAFAADGEWLLEFEERLPLPRDARPDGRDRGGARGHGGGAPDGPADLRRRGLRQDRGGAARRLQGRGGRQAGDVPRADDRARPAALRHLHRAHARLPGARSRWRRASARRRRCATRARRASPRARSTS